MARVAWLVGLVLRPRRRHHHAQSLWTFDGTHGTVAILFGPGSASSHTCPATSAKTSELSKVDQKCGSHVMRRQVIACGVCGGIVRVSWVLNKNTSHHLGRRLILDQVCIGGICRWC
jgi:hypothetical protein